MRTISTAASTCTVQNIRPTKVPQNNIFSPSFLEFNLNNTTFTKYHKKLIIYDKKSPHVTMLI